MYTHVYMCGYILYTSCAIIMMNICALHHNPLPRSSNCTDHYCHNSLLFSRKQALEQQLSNASNLGGDFEATGISGRMHAVKPWLARACRWR